LSPLKEKILLVVSDFLSVNIAWSVYYYIRISSGWIPYANPTSFLLPLIVIYIYWIITFSFAGLYQHWFIRSRFDEFSSVIKAVSIGCFILFFVIFLDDAMTNSHVISRFLILIYWSLMIVMVGSGRILIRGFQMSLLERGIGQRNTMIIGSGQRARYLFNIMSKFPQLGYKLLGFISLQSYEKSDDILGELKNVSGIVKEKEISEAIIALEQNEKEKLMDVLRFCSDVKINLKILPDTYEIVSGLVKTNQIYGVPLIEVMPGIMSYGAKLFKRVMDLTISAFLLLLFSPFLIISFLMIKISSKGGIFYKQTRVGKGGKLFTMYKLRTMFENAEEYGPEWAGENDLRITAVGRILRKTYFDEFPQMFNVFKNEMSLVGPRPERPHFVEILKNEIPYYYKRLNIKPGITGWAQIKHKYDSSLDDVKVKLQYDFYYIENMSLKLDFKIIINTIIVIIFMKGH
jgi:exopolysaccharide biosynthesis polyprenyl glycosylphosphotransferase